MRFINRFKRIFSLSKPFSPYFFHQQTEYINMAAAKLLEMVQTSDHDEWRRLEREVKELELKGDAVLSAFQEELYENFQSKIDRIDLQNLAVSLDKLLDNINNAAKSILLYFPKKIDVHIIEIIQYIVDETDALKQVICDFSDFKKNSSSIILQCERITELEHAADDAYAEYIGYIFNNEKDFIELMKYKNIAEILEDTTDSAKSISDNLRKILLHYTTM